MQNTLEKGRTVIKPVLLAILCMAASFMLRQTPARAVQKAPNTYTIPLPPQADYSSLQWLIGEWSGKTTGKGPQGEVLLSVSYFLGKRFVVFREQVSLPATKAAPASHEGFMGILSGSPSGKGYDLALYSSNGFVTHYQVSVEQKEIDFNPQGGAFPPPGWLFRRVIRQTTTGQCTESVDAAPPGQPFFNYYTANLSQVTPGPKAKHPSGGEKAKHRRLLFWRRKQ